MAEDLYYHDQQMNCSGYEESTESNQSDSYNLDDKYQCSDMNGDFKRTLCDDLPNNNVFVGATVSPCYNSELECSNNTNNISVPIDNTPSSSSPASGINPYSNESTPANDSFSENSQDFTIDQKVNANNSLRINIQKLEDNYKQQYETEYNNGIHLNKSYNKVTKSNKKKDIGTARGRPRKALVPMYHSQISGDKNAIKICIKKSNLIAPNKKKSGRRRRPKTTSDTDASDYESKKKKVKNEDAVNKNEYEFNTEPQEQTIWGNSVPEEILYKIFQYTCQDGSLPTLIRLSRVCKLWRDVATQPSLWNKVDLNWVKERFRTDIKLHWLIQERLVLCQDLNLGEWKIRNIHNALEALSIHCSHLKGLNLSSWKGLNADDLKYISTEFTKLERLDLSSINSSSLNAQPLVNLMQTMNTRLTHLVLAHNKLSGFTQIMTSIAENCSNLQLLDISNIRTFAEKSTRLHIEKLQTGCPNLRVLRITNSHIILAPATLSEQMSSPGFPMLEELSLAGVEDKMTTARAVSDDDIERILKTSTKLKLLDIRGCIKLTDSGLVKVPAWDLEHLFLSGCYITRTQNSGLELILQKWSHSLVEVDLAWSTATSSLDAAVLALAEKGNECPIQIINLCGSSVSLEPIKTVLSKCPNVRSINLQSCRALPRGIKRYYSGGAVKELIESLQDKPKIEEQSEFDAEQGSHAELNTL